MVQHQDPVEIAYLRYGEASERVNAARQHAEVMPELEEVANAFHEIWFRLMDTSPESDEPNVWLIINDELQPYLYVLYMTQRLCPSIAAWQLYNAESLYLHVPRLPIEPSGIDELRACLSWLVTHHLLAEQAGKYIVTHHGSVTLSELDGESASESA